MERVLITGGTGSLGYKLTERLLQNKDIKEIRIYSRNEKNQYLMAHKFKDSRLKFILADIRDYDKVVESLSGIDTVINAAALKHITLGDKYPEEFIKTNIMGTMNVIKACKLSNVKTLIHISTDKACQPTNLYGMTKATGEVLVCHDDLNNNSNLRKFCVRYGNVAGSNGSVIPFFRQLIREGKPLTVTDKDMTRFFITLDEAVDLILFAYKRAKTNEIFVKKAPSFKIIDLAKVMMDYYKASNKTIKIIGILSYGEKIHEVLVSEGEVPRAMDLGDYIMISREFVENPLKEHYSSEKSADKKELINLFKKMGNFD